MALVSTYSQVGLTSGSTDVPAFGTAWLSDAATNGYSANRPTIATRRGRNQCAFWMANTGTSPFGNTARNNGGFDVRNVGFAWAGQTGGVLGPRRILFGGSNFAAASLYMATDPYGCLRIQSDSEGNIITFGQALPLPANETVVLMASGASSTYCKVLGLPAVTGAQFGASGTTSWNLFYEGAVVGDVFDARYFGVLDCLKTYSAATDITGSAASIEAALAAAYGYTVPTAGNVVGIGHSITQGRYTGIGSHNYFADMANAQPQYFWKNNGWSGQTFATAITDYANLVTAAYNRPLTGKPTAFFIDLGTNECLASTPAATFLTGSNTSVKSLVALIRADFPTSPIYVNKIITVGSTQAINTIRMAYNNGVQAVVAPYGAVVVDLADGVSSLNPTANTDVAVAACTAGAPYQSYNATPTLGAGDRIHLGPAAVDLIKPNAVALAGMINNALTGGGIRSRNYRTRNYR